MNNWACMIAITLMSLLINTEVKSDIGCASGQDLLDVQEGFLGAFPSTGFQHVLCFEVNNDSAVDRYEIAYAAVPISQAQNLNDAQLSRLLVLGPNNQVLASSFKPISRWAAPLASINEPIRWLQIALPAKVLANSVNRYELRLLSTDANLIDPFALTYSQNNNQHIITSPLAQFKISSDNQGVFDQIDMDHDGDFNNSLETVYLGSTDDVVNMILMLLTVFSAAPLR